MAGVPGWAGAPALWRRPFSSLCGLAAPSRRGKSAPGLQKKLEGERRGAGEGGSECHGANCPRAACEQRRQARSSRRSISGSLQVPAPKPCTPCTSSLKNIDLHRFSVATRPTPRYGQRVFFVKGGGVGGGRGGGWGAASTARARKGRAGWVGAGTSRDGKRGRKGALSSRPAAPSPRGIVRGLLCGRRVSQRRGDVFFFAWGRLLV